MTSIFCSSNPYEKPPQKPLPDEIVARIRYAMKHAWQTDYAAAGVYFCEYGGSPPEFTRDHYCVISAAIFSDGSYEGDAETAAGMKAMLRGRRRQLARLVGLLKNSLASSEADAGAILRGLGSELSALKTDIDEEEIKTLTVGFRELPADPRIKSRLINSFRVALQATKTMAINDLSSFQTTQGFNLNKQALQLWLQKTGKSTRNGSQGFNCFFALNIRFSRAPNCAETLPSSPLRPILSVLLR